MHNKPLTTVLLADDEDTLRENLAQVLREEGFNVIACRDGSLALKALRQNDVGAMITDLRMPGVSGMDLIDHARKLAPDAVIIVITAFGEVETAVEAMKKGVSDYICKPLILDEVIFKLKRLLAHDDLEKENKLLKEQLRVGQMEIAFIGRSPSITAIKDTVARVCNTMSNVLIFGESGTGKEVVARAIHHSGVTKDKPFIAVNCGGLADTLVESELFGYRKGAFTGADTDRAGYFETANGGTLFLDEIGNLPYHSQAVLLRAIEQRAVTRVGESKPRPVHIRVVAATNRDLTQAVESGNFREDLYYRLNVIQVTIPPLRDRREDIRLLADHFLRQYNTELNVQSPGFTDSALEAMMNYPWRGNVRELENVVERALIFAGGRSVSVDDLALGVTPSRRSAAFSANLRAAVHEFEREHITKVLLSVGGDKAQAAQVLGIGLSSLYRKLEELDISKGQRAEASAS
ncbi:MAG: sigma-54 dependent transcriptional regulator [Planctomycetota bacterium]